MFVSTGVCSSDAELAYLQVNDLLVLLLELLLQLRSLVLGRILLLLGSLALLGGGRIRVPPDGGRGCSCARGLLSDGRKGGRAHGSLSRGAEEGSLEHCDGRCEGRDAEMVVGGLEAAQDRGDVMMQIRSSQKEKFGGHRGGTVPPAGSAPRPASPTAPCPQVACSMP